jgi:hypothetical protein
MRSLAFSIGTIMATLAAVWWITTLPLWKIFTLMAGVG